MDNITNENIAIRAYDITLCLERNSVSEFDLLTSLGLAVRLTLHLRGVPAVDYLLLRDVCIHLLDFPSTAVRPVLELLAEAEFVRLETEGKTIKSIIPDIPYYENIFESLTEVAEPNSFSEPEAVAIGLLEKLSDSPLLKDHAYQSGADKKLVDRMIDIGKQGSFIITKRARGRDILISPTYFSETPDSYADLVAGAGSSRVKKILDLLKQNQGWPLKKIISDQELSGIRLDTHDLQVVKMLAGEGFVPPPAIQTSHSGTNHFLFGPMPGGKRLPAVKRPIYEAAMALVAAVRQGQLLPSQYRIRWPSALLCSLREKGFLRASTEALEQYRQVAALNVGRLNLIDSQWARFELIPRPENYEAVDLAISMVSGASPSITSSDDIVIALRKGEKYIESLIGRKKLLTDNPVTIDEESLHAIDSFLLRGHA